MPITKNKFKKIKKTHDREELLEAICIARQLLTEDRKQLSGFYSSMLSLTVLPVTLYFAINNLGVVNYLFDYYFPIISEIIKNKFESRQYMITKRLQHDDAIFALKSFEKQIVDATKTLVKENPEIRKYFGITDIADENAWPYPWRLSKLSSINGNHLLFKFAQFVDEGPYRDSYQHLRLSFIQILNRAVPGMFNPSNIHPMELAECIPEWSTSLRLLDDKTSKTSTLCAAKTLRTASRNVLNFERLYENEIRGQAKSATEQYLASMEYFTAFGASMLLHGLLITPLTERLLPVHRELTANIHDNQNYILMTTDLLTNKQTELELIHEKLSPTVNKYRKISYFIDLFIILLAVYAFIQQVRPGGPLLSFATLIYVPLLMTMIMKPIRHAIHAWNDNYNLDQNLSYVNNNIKEILGKAANYVDIQLINNELSSLSTVKLVISGKYDGISTTAIGDRLALTFQRFGISTLNSYNRTVFYVPAQTTFKQTVEMKTFFQTSLLCLLKMRELKTQLNKLTEFFVNKNIARTERNIRIDAQELYYGEYVVQLYSDNHHNIRSILLTHGFHPTDDCLILIKNEPYEKNAFKSLIDSLEIACKSTPSKYFEIETESYGSKNTKPRPGKTKRESEELEKTTPKTTSTIPEKSIEWSSCKAKFPDNAYYVKGSINSYMFWTLTENDFGEHKDSITAFKEASKQKASAGLGKKGVKNRPTISGHQLFPAHIKIPGHTYGNQGVVLDIIKAPTGEQLYITRGFDSNIHQGIKPK